MLSDIVSLNFILTFPLLIPPDNEGHSAADLNIYRAGKQIHSYPIRIQSPEISKHFGSNIGGESVTWVSFLAWHRLVNAPRKKRTINLVMHRITATAIQLHFFYNRNRGF